MRTVWNFVRLWLVGMLGLSDLWVWFAPRTPPVWQGATADWSPVASVAAAGDTAGWDMDGWYRDANRDTHKRLALVQARVNDRLEDVLAAAYRWADGEITAREVRRSLA